MKVAIYVRVSTDEQAQEGFSIAAQKEKLAAFVQSQDWTIHDYYIDEGVSAKNTERPELQRLLQDIRSRQIDVVLVYKLDRLTRSVMDLYGLLEKFEKYDVKFKSATEVYDTTTAIGRLFITLVAALAQWERENLGERVRMGMEQMVREGKWPGGAPPYGYKLENGKLQVREEETQLIREIFDLYLKGNSLNEIARVLQKRGLTGKKGSPWTSQTVDNVLRNHTYYGAIRWNLQRRRKAGQKFNDPSQWIITENQHEPIILKETFLQTQELINMKSFLLPRQVSSPYAFSGVVHCPYCHGCLTGHETSKNNKNGKSYRSYYCANSKHGKCIAPPFSISDRKLEELFLNYLKDHVNSSAFEIIQEKQDKPKVNIQGQLQKISDMRKRLNDLYLIGSMSLDDVITKQRELDNQERSLRLTESDQSITLSKGELLQLLKQVGEAWDEMSETERRSFVFTMVRSLIVEYASDKKRGRLGREHRIREIVFR